MINYQLIVNDWRCFYIEISIKSDRKIVKDFLKELRKIIFEKDFDIDKQFVLIRSSKDELEYSTPYTLLDLEFDEFDIIKCLGNLGIEDYSETLFDRDDDKPPLLFVFGKDINSRKIYIKLKIKGEETKRILCVSFHYAKYKMDFPYA